MLSEVADCDLKDTLKSQYIRRNDRREAGEKPLNRQFCMAGSSVNAAEMAQVQRIAPVMPPRAYFAYWGVVTADLREDAAENAKLNAI